MIASLYRFHGHNSLRYVYSNGKAIRSRLVTLKWVINTHRTRPRIAVVVSKKVIKSAVARNRIRRRVYEYIRPRIPELTQVIDMVFIVTSSELLTMSAEDVHEQLEQVVSQAQLFKTTEK